jgi:predicted HicB family RNase H-like nuclease
MSGILQHRGYAARAEFDADDQLFVGRIAGINDIVSFHADSVAGLVAAFREAVDDYLETCDRIGKKPEKAYSGNLMLRIDPSVHAAVALKAELEGESVNQWAEEVLRAAAG